MELQTFRPTQHMQSGMLKKTVNDNLPLNFIDSQTY